jgi:enoyl-CoA hydratase/carnithine racemase
MIEITDDGRIRVVTLRRPEVKNAMDTAMWDATAEAFLAAAHDSGVAVVVLTGHGDAFCAGQDVIEMGRLAMGERIPSTHGFAGLTEILVDFPKPLVLAVNGLGVGFGATVVGLADLVFMSTAARLKCPFTGLGVAPELASSATFPALIGRQNATWALMSSEWLSAEDCLEMGLVYRLCEPEELMDVTMAHARTLAAKPISSLVETKATIVEPTREALHAARQRENEAFARLMGGPANLEAMTAFAEKREPDFDGID